MITRIQKAIIALVSLITFGLVGAADSETWECECSQDECEWCGFIFAEPVSELPELSEDEEWEAFWADSFEDHAREFDMLFNAMEYKRAKNGAAMIRRPGDKSFKFAKRS